MTGILLNEILIKKSQNIKPITPGCINLLQMWSFGLQGLLSKQFCTCSITCFHDWLLKLVLLCSCHIKTQQDESWHWLLKTVQLWHLIGPRSIRSWVLENNGLLFMRKWPESQHNCDASLNLPFIYSILRLPFRFKKKTNSAHSAYRVVTKRNFNAPNHIKVPEQQGIINVLEDKSRHGAYLDLYVILCVFRFKHAWRSCVYFQAEIESWERSSSCRLGPEQRAEMKLRLNTNIPSFTWRWKTCVIRGQWTNVLFK